MEELQKLEEEFLGYLQEELDEFLEAIKEYDKYSLSDRVKQIIKLME